MTIAELKELIKDMPDDASVYLLDSDAQHAECAATTYTCVDGYPALVLDIPDND